MTETPPLAPPEAPPGSGHTIDAEIFSVGTWNGERFTRRDLHEIARNFRRLSGQLQPPLKFGHDAGQTLLGQQDGDPALGWVQALWVRGDRLMARFAGVPRVVLEAIRAGRYRRVSAELYFHVRRGGRALGKALKAVALLGADLPAVTNLQELSAYLASAAPQPAPPAPAAGGTGEAAAVDFAALATRIFALPVQDGRIAAAAHSTPLAYPMPEEATMTEPESPPAQQAELAELRAYRERHETRQAEEHRRRAAEAFRSARASAADFCAAQVQAGRLPPHLHERLLRELDGQARSFAQGPGLQVSFDWVRRFMEALPPVLPSGEVAHAAPPPEADGGADANPSVTLARLAGNAMAELQLGYGEAAAYVLRTQPALARAYRDYTLNPN